MVRRPLALLVAALLLCLVSACGEGTLRVNVQLLTKSCPNRDGQTVDVLADPGVTHLEFIVSGDGLEAPLTTVVSRDAGEASIPDIPLGPPGEVLTRLIEVRAHFDGAGGPVVALGSSVVQMSSDNPGPITVPIFLRPIQSFLYTARADAPDSCTVMTKARMGHTATALKDGRVLIVGGAELDSLGGRTVQKSAEIFDPRTGTFTLLEGDAAPLLPRVFHTATLLPDGRVLIAGGEADVDGKKEALRPAEIFDPVQNAFLKGPENTPAATIARTRHTASLTTGGLVVLVGGYTDPNPAGGQSALPVATTEFYDPAKNRFFVGPELPEPKAEHCAATITGDSVIVLAGGKTLTGGMVEASDTIYFLRSDGATVSLLTQGGAPLTEHLGTARYALGCARVTAGGRETVVFGGGFTTVGDFGSSSAHAGIERFDPAAQPAIEEVGQLGGGARGNLCAVKTDESTVVFLGGYNSDDPVASASADAVSGGDGGFQVSNIRAKMNDPRFQQACTRLADGTILVTGGWYSEPRQPGDPLSLKTAELYTPISLRSP